MFAQSGEQRTRSYRLEPIFGNKVTLNIPLLNQTDEEVCLHTACFTYASSAVVGDRQIVISFANKNDHTYGTFPSPAVQPKSENLAYNFCIAGEGSGGKKADRFVIVIPVHCMTDGDTVTIEDVNNIDPLGDSISFTGRALVRDPLYPHEEIIITPAP